MNIVLCGYYGMSNFGDDLFVATLAERLSPRIVHVLSPPVRGVRAEFLVPGILGRAFESTGLTGQIVRTVSGILAGAFGKTLIMGGGSVLHGQSTMLNSLMAVGRLRRAELFGIGVSVGPFIDESFAVRTQRQLSAFKALGLRDMASFKHLPVAVRSVWTGDIAALHPRLQEERAVASAGPLIAPCSAISAEEHVAAFLGGRNEGSGKLVTILVLNCHPTKGDGEVAEAVAGQLEVSGFEVRVLTYSQLGIDATIDQFKTAEFVVSGRLHGGIVSYLAGVPFVLLKYHRKCRDFLDEIGYRGVRETPLVPPRLFTERAEKGFADFLERLFP